MTVFTWSKTASANSNADSSINWAEGQAPSSVNDSSRAGMAAIAKYRDDNAGSLVTAGTSTAYTLTSNQVFTSLTTMSGMSLRVKFNATNGAAPTLNVDTLGAKAIQTLSGTAVATGSILANSVQDLVYDNSIPAWILVGAPSGVLDAPATTAMLFQQVSAPAGWTKSATNDNKALRLVSGGSGGTAAGTTAFTSVFAARTILQGNLPSVNLNPNTANQALAHTSGAGAAISPNSGSAGTTVQSTGGTTIYNTSTYATIPDHTVTFPTVALGGSGTAMDFAVQYVDVIMATKD